MQSRVRVCVTLAFTIAVLVVAHVLVHAERERPGGMPSSFAEARQKY